MKVIIAGSRSLTDPRLINKAVSRAPFGSQITEVVCGMAGGIDLLGAAWADQKGIPVIEMPANWKSFGRKAGILRNIEMGNYADALIAIWDGHSPGTKHMINFMLDRKKSVHLLSANDPNEL